MKKAMYIVVGFLMLGLGVVGILLPILPTTPFLLLASSFFAAGSEKFHGWFVQLPIHKKYLASFINDRAMTLNAKLQILLPVSGMLIITMVLIPNFWARLFIMIVLVSKYVYFFTQIETISNQTNKVSSNISDKI